MTISSVDYAPDELHDQTPIVVNLVREMPGPDRPDYWLGELLAPIRWAEKGGDVDYLILAARWEGTQIEPGMEQLPVGIAYVTDQTLLNDVQVDFDKCAYIAVGTVQEVCRSR